MNKVLHLLILIFASVVLMPAAFAFQCNPSGTDVAGFTSSVYTSMSANGCLVCHGSASHPNAKMVFNTDPAQTDIEATSNLCVAYKYGQKTNPPQLIWAPLFSAKHQKIAGQYSQTELASLIIWVNQYRLP